MQDYIEDLLDDVEEFDDDIADDYSDIWVIIANPQFLIAFYPTVQDHFLSSK